MIELVTSDGPVLSWRLRATEIPAAERLSTWKLGFCAEIIGRDDTYRYQRSFHSRLLMDPSDAGKVVWYTFRPREEPYLLDIRHEQRGYYVLHAGIVRPELAQITESLLAELLIARELDKAAFQTSAFSRTTLDIVREIKDSKLKRSLLKTLDKATRIDDATREAAREFNQMLKQAQRAAPPAIQIVDRQRIRRVHFDS